MAPLRFSLFLCLLSFFWLSACDNDGTTENATEVGIEDTDADAVSEQDVTPVADAEFSDAMIDKVFQNYLTLRTALVNSDAAGASTAADNMATTFTDERRELQELASRIAATDDLAVQRTAFSELTVELEGLLENALSAGTIYKLHCPMAFDGEGADWYSEVSEIRNPYFGDAMLTCGRVEEEISGS